MGVYHSRATVLRLRRLSDTSLIVHWFTDEHGIVHTVAKGAMRPKSVFSGRLDLFLTAEIEYHWAKRGSLHALREVKVESWRERLRKSYKAMLFGAYCTELVEMAVEVEHPDGGVHDLLIRVLNYLGEKEADERGLQHFENELAKLLGVYDGRWTGEKVLRDHLGRMPVGRGELLQRLRDSGTL